MTARDKLLLLLTEDWFARSHFLPLIRRAQAEGYEVVVAARRSGADLGDVKIVDFPFARGSLRLRDLWREARRLQRLIRDEKPRIVHAVAIRPIALMTMTASRDAGVVFALTGRGFLALHRRFWFRCVTAVIRAMLSAALTARAGRVLLVENQADAEWVFRKRRAPPSSVVLMPGAGVDPDRFTCAPEPDGPVVVGFVGRLLHAKGVDLLVAAVEALREAGLDVRLAIAGETDPDHPRQFPAEIVERWRSLPFVTLAGRIDDINAFWRGAHIACLPSRGGEGLPRAMLEAAACGRPIVTTAVAGCAEFVIDGENGRVATKDDSSALAAALADLAKDSEIRRRMGLAARAKVIAGYTEAHAATRAALAWELSRGGA